MKTAFVITALALNSLFCMAQTDNPIGAIFSRGSGETPEGIYRLSSGGYEVYTIAASDKSFQPASLYYGQNDADKAKVDAMAPDGKVPTAMNCFLVRTPAGYIMFDTGLPASNGGLTEKQLESLKVSQDEIKAIYLTHGHFDHIGGLLDDAGKAAYANATVYIPAAELEFMRTTMQAATEKIETAYRGRTVVFEPGEILPGDVLPVSAKGHTPGHTAYLLGNLLFAGDLMHGMSIQLIDPTICASYDANRNQAIETRIRLLSYAAANSLTVLGAHIPGNGVIF